MATLLRAFARDGDRLWLPAPVAPEVMADVPGLPRPILESGPFAELEPADEILAWGETSAVARMRQPDDAALRPGKGDYASRAVEAWELPWRLPLPSPESTAAVNDRRFDFELTGEFGCRLPGACIVASPDEFEAHLAATGIERWVLKAPFSAAGRQRLIHRSGPAGDEVWRRIERLFARHGELVFEPWMERTVDFGCAAAVTHSSMKPVSVHRQLVDGNGRFRGVELIAGSDGIEGPWLEIGDDLLLGTMLRGIAGALRRTGYVGPFGLDLWRYRSPEGREAIQLLGEINGRLTFGWVARALVDRVRGPLGIAPGDRVRLVLGKREDVGAGVRIVPLLHAMGDSGGPRAWLEIAGP